MKSKETELVSSARLQGASTPPPTLLCTADFPSNTGFAWTYIEGTYARLADRLAKAGVRTLVAYPSIGSAPATLAGSAAEAVQMDTSLRNFRGLCSLMSLVRRENVQVLYGTDRPTWHPAFAALRAAGIRKIVVHDHSSGSRVPPRGAKKFLKRAALRMPWVSSDVVVAVSDFVANRQINSGQVPPERVVRVYNGVEVEGMQSNGGQLRVLLGTDQERPIVGCSCRCTKEKGVSVLLVAFDAMLEGWPLDRPRPILAYIGHGPHFDEMRNLVATLRNGKDIRLLGYHPDASSLLAGADLCVVPSVWQEAFGLAVVEPMSRGKPVVASQVGAIPELIEHGVSGILVPPGDTQELSLAMRRLLLDPSTRERLGAAARARMRTLFSLEDTIDRLEKILVGGLGVQPVKA